MDFEINKILGAVLGAAFMVFSVAIVSDAIFASPAPEKPGYAIEAVEETGGATAQTAAAVPIGQLLASANADAGATIFKKCQACHSGEKGGPNKVGPDLWGVVGRPVAAHEGFSYSAGMKEFSQGGSQKWDFEHLNGFLTAPKSYVKGTAMSFAGLKKDDERANLIAYLRTLSDDPLPLPAADAAPAPENASAPGGAAPAADQGAAPAPAAPATPPAGEPATGAPTGTAPSGATSAPAAPAQ
ncbi:MAG: cytochrome c family protein [Methylobacterium mesophilicum]|nr:cytochrome c family protein [Methylobacterium mesophilicum]